MRRTLLLSAVVAVCVVACGRSGFVATDGGITIRCDACPIRAGSVAVPIAAGSTCYCIDSTEVTRRQYGTFLDAGPVIPTIPECTWKTSYTPSSGTWPPDGGIDNPIANVDWCDAWAYCNWAGKRLCGSIGGGETAVAAVTDPAESQWFRACSRNGELVYPYGDTYDPNACRGEQTIDPTSTIPVASYPGCQGGYPGIFDMSGNVMEWEDACESTTGATDRCHARGGGKHYFADALMCASLDIRMRSARNSDVGIRCCAP